MYIDLEKTDKVWYNYIKGTNLLTGTYTYSDAWGNHSVSYSNGGGSTGAQYNPFRYRGYYYDTDLYMYYLQSRYCDAKICRFISAEYASVDAYEWESKEYSWRNIFYLLMGGLGI